LTGLCSKIKQVVVPWARTRPSLSVNFPSAVPIRRPQLMTLPSAFTKPVCGVMGRTREILNSSVVCANPVIEHGQDGETHAAVEQRGGKASVHSAERIAVPRMGFCGGNNAAFGNLDNIVSERFRHRVQGQRAIDEPLNKFETTHCLSMVVVHDAKAFPNEALRHELSQASRSRRGRGDLPQSPKRR
jgi:hypothetical protein